LPFIVADIITVIYLRTLITYYMINYVLYDNIYNGELNRNM